MQCVPPSSGKNIAQAEATDLAKKIKSQFFLVSEEYGEIQIQLLRGIACHLIVGTAKVFGTT